MKKSSIFSRLSDSLSLCWANYKALDGRGKLSWWRSFLFRNSLYFAVIALVIFSQVYAAQHDFSKRFFSLSSIMEVVNRSAGALFPALGVGGIVILGGVDFSADRVIGLTSCVSVMLLQKPLEEYSSKMYPDLLPPPIILVILNALMIGAVTGAINGFLITKTKAHSSLVTLCTRLMIYGVSLWFFLRGVGGNPFPMGGYIDQYKNVIRGSVMIGKAAIPYYVFYAIAAALIVWFVWNKTALGRKMFAVGANREAANAAGISVAKTTIFVFMVGGILYGFSGFVDAMRFGGADIALGEFAFVDAITACLIGGVSVSGGTGKIKGIVFGVILLQIITVSINTLMLWGYDYIYIALRGVLLLIGLTTNRRRFSRQHPARLAAS